MLGLSYQQQSEYKRHVDSKKEQENAQEPVTTEEILGAFLEIAESISDLEDAIVELAGMEG